MTDCLAHDVDGVKPPDEEYHGEEQQQQHRQGEECSHRDEQVGLGVVAGVAAVADPASVPIGAHGAI